MNDFPEGTPAFVKDAINAIEEKSRTNLFDAAKSSDVCRGYMMAVQEIVNEIESQAALERGEKEEAAKAAIKRYQDTHGQPAS